MITLYISHIRPLLEFGTCVWNLEYTSDIKLLENVHWQWTKRVDGFEYLTCSQKLIDIICFRLRENYWKLTSSNTGKHSVVNVGYVRRIYLFYLGAVLLVATVSKLLMIFFKWLVGRGRVVSTWNLPYQTMLLLLKECYSLLLEWKIVSFRLACFC